MTEHQAQLSRQIKQQATEQGFDLIGIAPAVSPSGFHPLLEWINAGHHADMDWIPRRKAAYQHPDGVLPEVRSVVIAAMNYHHADFEQSADACVARYAFGPQDYHDELRRRLKPVASMMHENSPADRTRIVVDTAPLLERDFGRLAGIGWQGKNTMLISRQIGSWFFLSALLTTAELAYDQPVETDHCGTCQACLDVCPTDAFPQPRVLDANRCISYLTIERRQQGVPEDLRSEMGSWLFGCDLCQDVCPWNRFAPDDSIPQFRQRPELKQMRLADWLKLSPETFLQQFSGTPLERTGRDVLVRNSLIAAGNSQDKTLRPLVETLTDDASILVREAAAWAMERLPA